MEWQKTRLGNGMVVAAAPMPYMESVSVGVWVMSGARHEPARLNGVSHFLEHVVFKGTRRRTAAGMMREVEGAGGVLNAYTEIDHTVYYAKAEAGKLGLLVDVLADLYAGATLPVDEVERERDVIGEEIVMYAENPGQHIDDVAGLAAWPGHALGRPVTGTAASVAGIRRRDLVAWRDRRHVGANTLVVAAGRVGHGELVAEVEARLGRVVRGGRARDQAYVVGRRARVPRVEHDEREIEQAHLSVGFHAPGRGAPERYALSVLNVVLGENMSSRLFQRLREERGLCYSVQSELTLLRETGLLSVYAGLDPGDLGAALRLVADELRRLAVRGPGRQELREAIDYSVGMMRMGLEGTTERMTWLGEGLLARGRVTAPREVEARLAAVTADEVRRVAAAVFRPGLASVALVGPPVDRRALREPFRRLV